ncbi:hypothetical protein [Halarsenatibacter silvermanii]|uniref:DUF4351 domain-containing protein n=1 Tax=Halarsenatibacter silvermanii TaxID=321763 RepID=A0A1G9HDX8_9FIRM|nr:hypothetical protein [Halarsenatibacter silvermanii]SDL10693.1 hypothetical protein SAMN04488692_101174 [Halarsenatibacter silvermanii]
MKTLADELKEEGFEHGKEKGRIEELRETVEKLLEMRLGELSSDLTDRIGNTPREELVEIRDSIFEIESEEDVEEILHE